MGMTPRIMRLAGIEGNLPMYLSIVRFLTSMIIAVAMLMSVYVGTKQVLDTLDEFPSCFPPFTYIPASELSCPRAPTVSQRDTMKGLVPLNRSYDWLNELNPLESSDG